MANSKEEMLPLLKSLEEDLSRLSEKQKMVEKLTPSGKMVETEMAQLFSKIRDALGSLSTNLAVVKKLIEQLNYGNSFIVDALREGSDE